jgi:hypothetical protein
MEEGRRKEGTKGEREGRKEGGRRKERKRQEKEKNSTEPIFVKLAADLAHSIFFQERHSQQRFAGSCADTTGTHERIKGL